MHAILSYFQEYRSILSPWRLTIDFYYGSTYIRSYGFTFFYVKCSKTLDRLYVNKKINVKKYFDAKFYVKLRNRQLSILLCIQHTVAKADTVQVFFKHNFQNGWIGKTSIDSYYHRVFKKKNLVIEMVKNRGRMSKGCPFCMDVSSHQS